MTESRTTLLSVRGDAHLEVPPDLARLTGLLRVYASSKPDALGMAAASLEAVLADLRTLDGAPMAARTVRGALVWAAHSATTEVEREWESDAKRPTLTGRIIATVAFQIEVRDFTVMDRLGAALAKHADLHVHGVEWFVDADNPAWPRVRAAAIEAAILKGRDYAVALGGSLQRIEHVADAGLLAGEGRPEMLYAAAMSGRASKRGSMGEEGETPSLDPVPQQLQAVIDARFTASVGPVA